MRQMKIKLVYGAPCSGKSTYVKEHVGEHDLIWDFDKLLMACTNRTQQVTGNHPMANFVIDLRKMIIDAARSKPSLENLFITCLWVTDKLKGELEGLDAEEIFIDADKDECFQRLSNDDARPDKGEWKKLINTWFKEHSSANKTPKRFWNFIGNEAGERILRIDGAIGDSAWSSDEITPKTFRAELNAGDGDVTVWINSEGGDVFAAVEIFNMLKEYRGNVTVKIDSLAASAASIIAMAGDEVQISPSGMIMIHNPWTVIQGDSAEMRASAEMLDGVKESIINAYEQKTHLPRDEISRLMDDETWLPANKAVELHFADKIMFSENQSEAQAFSRRQVMNCATTAIKTKIAAVKKAVEDTVVGTKKSNTAGGRAEMIRARKRLKLGGLRNGTARAV